MDGVQDIYLSHDRMFVTDNSGMTREVSYSDEYRDTYSKFVEKYKPENNNSTQDFSENLSDYRCRGHVFHTLNGWVIALRILKSDIPSLASLGFQSEDILSVCQSSGITLFVGPTGAGKSSTMTAAAEELKLIGERGVTVTIEEPIEYLYDCPMTFQREAYIDTVSPSEGVREAMRERPRTIIIGEIRDSQTAKAAIKAGLTGHRVLTTIHGRHIIDGISQLFGFLPENYHDLLANSLQGVVAQALARFKDSKTSPLPIYETLACTRTARSVISAGPSRLSQLVHEFKNQKRFTIHEHGQRLVTCGSLSKVHLNNLIGKSIGV